MGSRARKGITGLIGLPLGLLLAVAPAGAAQLLSPGCLAGGELVAVRAVTATLELELEDGRTVLLPGIDPVQPTATRPTAAQDAASALARWLAGQTMMLNVLTAAPDRWARTLALAFAVNENGTAGVSVAEALLDAGAGRARPDSLIAACWPRFLGVERQARAAKVGLWSDPDYAVVPADSAVVLAARTGAMAVVEGVVQQVRPGRARTYVAFDHRGRDGFALTIPRPMAVRLQRAGSDPAAWTGRRLRVRGFLDDRFGLQIELTSLDQVEFIDP